MHAHTHKTVLYKMLKYGEQKMIVHSTSIETKSFCFIMSHGTLVSGNSFNIFLILFFNIILKRGNRITNNTYFLKTINCTTLCPIIMTFYNIAVVKSPYVVDIASYAVIAVRSLIIIFILMAVLCYNIVVYIFFSSS